MAFASKSTIVNCSGDTVTAMGSTLVIRPPATPADSPDRRHCRPAALSAALAALEKAAAASDCSRAAWRLRSPSAASETSAMSSISSSVKPASSRKRRARPMGDSSDSDRVPP